MELSVSKDAFASIIVGTFEPIIVDWISALGLGLLHLNLVNRGLPTRATLPPSGGSPVPTLGRFVFRRSTLLSDPKPLSLPAATAAPSAPVEKAAQATAALPLALSAPVLGGAAMFRSLSDADNKQRSTALLSALNAPDLNLASISKLLEKLKVANIPHLLGAKVEKVLAPLGIMHLYRQLHFDAGAALGPVEQVLAIAPAETLEVLLETTRRQTIERFEQFGLETTLENATEATNTEELSDQVQSTVTRDMSAGMSAQGSGTVGVWSAGASLQASLASSTEKSQTSVRNHLREVTRRSSEIIRKSYTLTVRDVTEIGTRSVTRRVLRNDSPVPINYALRRVHRKIRVKVQALGPRVVWQLYVSRPGAGLAQGRLCMFRPADDLAPIGLPPNAPPEPRGGSEGGSQTLKVDATGGLPIFGSPLGFVTIQVPMDPTKTVTAVVIDSIVDADPDGKDPTAPGLVGEEPPVAKVTGTLVLYTFKVARGSASRVNVTYTVHWQPSSAAIAQWQTQVAAALATYEASARDAEFERARKVITAKSNIRARPSADLRGEERYEILNRMISEAFQTQPLDGVPGPLEIELLHRYFDINSLFYYAHPSWWRPRYRVARGSYEITDESQPAPFGSSLGWILQADGDRRRNEFLNSPWMRVCLPIHPGMEKEATEWLAEHIEGRRGFDLGLDKPLGKLLEDIRLRREKEEAASPGPDYVTVDGEVAPSSSNAAAAYPVVDQFEVQVPTDGFVYETVTIKP